MKIFFSFLFFCLLQPAYSMENNDESIFSSVFNKLRSYTLYFPFCNAVELAQNRFSIEDCEIIKNYIIKGADPNWKIGENDETLLNLAVKYQKKDLFDFLLQHNADINASNKKGDTPFHTLMYVRGIAKLKLNRFNIDIEKLAKLKLNISNIGIEDLLKNKANFRAENNKGLTPLFIASFLGNSDDIKTLIKCGANINEKHSKKNHVTPLLLALCNKRSVESIKELCKLGASLAKDDKNNNTFHFITDPHAIHYIESLITHVRFDDFGKGSQTVPFALWLLKHWEIKNMIPLSRDVKLHILAQLDPYDLYPYKNLCKELLQKNYNYILLPLIHERVENMTQILASPNNENKTALQLMLEKFATNQEYINKLTPLLSGELLQNNYNDFIARFPAIVNSQKEEDKKNLARQMFDNCAELFLE